MIHNKHILSNLANGFVLVIICLMVIGQSQAHSLIFDKITKFSATNRQGTINLGLLGGEPPDW